MKHQLRIVLCLVAGVAAYGQQPPFTTIDYPEAGSTQAWGINARGEIVGLYIGVDTVHHGYLLSGNSFTAIDFPGASSTEVYGINSHGDIVGLYVKDGVTHGFLRSGNRFTKIDFPGADYTAPAAINAKGDIVGLYLVANVVHSFQLSGDQFTSIEYPGATTTQVNGGNDRGDIVGNYTAAGVTHAFVLRDGAFTSIDFANAAFTGAYGINQTGDVVGRYRDAAGITHGYLLSGGEFTSFEYPGATFTIGAAISARGDIVGRYLLDGVNHGYVLRPAQRQRYTVMDLGTLGGAASIAYGMSNGGSVAGAASLKTGDQHPFLWQRGKMTDLGTLGGSNAAATNPNGATQVSIVSETAKPDPLGEDFCGWGTHRTCLAAFWKDGKMTALPTLGGNNAIGLTLNERGQMVGAAEKSTHDSTCEAPQVVNFVPAMWGPDGTVQELRTLPGDTTGFAIGVNDRGDAVGSTGTCANTVVSSNGLAFSEHAVLWQGGVPISLGNLGGPSLAASVNNRGEVTGGSSLAHEEGVHGFLWTKERGMRDIGTLGEDGSSFPTVINNSGQITGGSCDAEFNCRTFLWEKNVMMDLNDLVAGHSSLYLVFGSWINDAGEIAGQAVDVNTGELHAFLATPAGGAPASAATVRNDAVPEAIRQMLRRRLDTGQVRGKR